MLRALDLGVYRLMRTRAHSPGLERVVAGLSRLGEQGALWITLALGAAAVDAERRPAYLRAARGVALAAGANYAVKLLVRRRRPAVDELPALTATLSSLSYPSAHATTSFTGARLLSESLPAAPLYATAVAMGLSRPYLGLHYPSDVLGGAALGTAIAALAR
jgi:undecaprenyl-diphosphatase